MLPEQKLDALLARHADDRSTSSRARSGAGHLCEAVARIRRAWPGRRDRRRPIAPSLAEIADLDALIADPDDRRRDARDGERRKAGAGAKARGARAADQARAAARRTRWTSATSFWKSAPAPAATRRRCSPAICSACTSATPPSRAGRSRSISASEGSMGGYKEIIAEIRGPRRVRQAQIRIRRASRPARARHRSLRTHPYVDRHRRRPARGRRCRRRRSTRPT